MFFAIRHPIAFVLYRRIMKKLTPEEIIFWFKLYDSKKTEEEQKLVGEMMVQRLFPKLI